jgi:hypothetical protein
VTLRGRLASRTMRSLMRRSAYVKDSVHHYLNWEEQFRQRYFSNDDDDASD